MLLHAQSKQRASSPRTLFPIEALARAVSVVALESLNLSL